MFILYFQTSEQFKPTFDSSRFRLHGRTLLTSYNLSRKHVSSSFHSPRKLQRDSNGKYVYTSYGLISPAIVLCGQGNTLCDSLKIGYQEQLCFLDSNANGFLNIADSKQKWDRLWCRIDGFSMHFWNYPQDVNDTVNDGNFYFLFSAELTLCFSIFIIFAYLTNISITFLCSNLQSLLWILTSATIERSPCLLIEKSVRDHEHSKLMFCMLLSPRNTT